MALFKKGTRRFRRVAAFSLGSLAGGRDAGLLGRRAAELAGLSRRRCGPRNARSPRSPGHGGFSEWWLVCPKGDGDARWPPHFARPTIRARRFDALKLRPSSRRRSAGDVAQRRQVRAATNAATVSLTAPRDSAAGAARAQGWDAGRRGAGPTSWRVYPPPRRAEEVRPTMANNCATE